LDAIRISNLRGISDTGFLDIKPITILLGKNGSGKSSTLRFFPLLKQSVEFHTRSPILWYGRYVDFGTFEKALSRQAKANTITFGFRLSLPATQVNYVSRLSSTIQYRRRRGGYTGSIELELTLGKRDDGESARVVSLRVGLADFDCIIECDQDETVRSIRLNGREFIHRQVPKLRLEASRPLIPRLTTEVAKPATTLEPPRVPFVAELTSIVKRAARARKGSTVADILSRIPLGPRSDILKAAASSEIRNQSWQRRVQDWSIGDAGFERFASLLFLHRLPAVLDAAGATLFETAMQVKYSAPLRANAERYYRFQDLAVGDVDAQGENLVMFLRNLSPDQAMSFSAWTAENFGFSVAVEKVGEHRALKLRESGSDADFDLIDMGFGYSQVLPVLVQLWSLNNLPRRDYPAFDKTPVIFAMEQPELHLHPEFQARFVDALMASLSDARARDPVNDIRFVVETHSEAMINQLGRLVYERRLNPEDVSLIVFEGRERDLRPRLATFDQDGVLQNWPYGFFRT